MLRDVVTEPRYVAEVDRVHDQVRNGPKKKKKKKKKKKNAADALSESPTSCRRWRPRAAAGRRRDRRPSGDHAARCASSTNTGWSLGLDRLMGAIGPAPSILVSVVIGAPIVSIASALLSIMELAL